MRIADVLALYSTHRRVAPAGRRRRAAATAIAILSTSVGAYATASPASPSPADPPVCTPFAGSAGFTHPGVIHTCADLDRMRRNVEAGRSPWIEGLQVLAADSLSRKAYQPRPALVIPWNSNDEPFRLQRDGTAAYQQTILWYVTRNDTYRGNALNIVRAWSVMREMHDYIRGGPGMLYLTAAAEILRSISHSGWTQADTDNYRAMLQRIEQAKLGLDQDNLFQNQGALAAEGLQAIAVFTEDKSYWDKVITRATTGANTTRGRDFAIDRSILPNGQIAEMGRDQGHPTGTMRAYIQIGYTILAQPGLRSPSILEFDGRRVRAAFEYWSHYNLGMDTPWRPHVVSTLSDYPRAEVYATLNPQSRGSHFPNLLSGAYYYYCGVDHLPPQSMHDTAALMKAQGPDMGWLLYAREDTPAP